MNARRDPDPDTIASREAAMDLVRRQARDGDSICRALLRLQEEASRVPGGSFVAGTGIDYADEEESEDGYWE